MTKNDERRCGMNSRTRFKIRCYIMLAKETQDEKLKSEYCKKAAELLESPELDIRDDADERDNIDDLHDAFDLFFEEYLSASSNVFSTVKEIFSIYNDFAKKNNFPALSREAIGRFLNSKGFRSRVKKVNGKTTRVYFIEIRDR